MVDDTDNGVVGEDDETEEDNDWEAVVPVPLDVRRVGGDGGKSPTSITLGVSNENVSAPNMIEGRIDTRLRVCW